MKKNLMCLAVLFGLALAVSYPAHSIGTAIGAAGTLQDRTPAMDGNGRTMTNEQVGKKVFEVIDSSAIFRVSDESGRYPTNGTLERVCISSGATSEFVVVADTNTNTGLTVATTGKRLMPPLHRATNADRCTPKLDAQFTSGIGALQNNISGSYYIYWRPNGGKN